MSHSVFYFSPKIEISSSLSKYDSSKVFHITGDNLDPSKLIQDLSYGLGGRVLRLACLDAPHGILIGLTLNSTNYYHPATHGPGPGLAFV